jgi:hypothetical protein
MRIMVNVDHQDNTVIVAGPEFPKLLVRSTSDDPTPNGRMLVL